MTSECWEGLLLCSAWFFALNRYQSLVKCFPLKFFGISIYMSGYKQVDFLDECLFSFPFFRGDSW